MTKQIIVCGGRTWGVATETGVFAKLKADIERNLLIEALDVHVPAGALIIQGGALGADHIAREWAYDNNRGSVTVPALWNVDGKAAGPIRNQKMLDEFEPDHVIAAPGGKGTADMVKRAQKAKIPIINVVEVSKPTIGSFFSINV